MACCGNGVVEAIEQFTIELFTDKDDIRPRRGGRPKPLAPSSDVRLEPFGLTNAPGRPAAG